jgi:hypothetical protein
VPDDAPGAGGGLGHGLGHGRSEGRHKIVCAAVVDGTPSPPPIAHHACFCALYSPCSSLSPLKQTIVCRPCRFCGDIPDMNLRPGALFVYQSGTEVGLPLDPQRVRAPRPIHGQTDYSRQALFDGLQTAPAKLCLALLHDLMLLRRPASRDGCDGGRQWQRRLRRKRLQQ